MLSVPDTETGLTEYQEALSIWSTPDLMTYAFAIGLMFAEIEVYAADRPDGTSGWSTMLDVDAIPTAGLPYLAQYVGERLPSGISDAENEANPNFRSDARQWIVDAPNQVRGTPYALARAAQRYLTGAKIVQIAERQTLSGTYNLDTVAVLVYADECPDPSAVAAELRKVVPADVTLDFNVSTGETWNGVHTAYSSWAAVMAANANWTAVRGQETGFTQWLR